MRSFNSDRVIPTGIYEGRTVEDIIESYPEYILSAIDEELQGFLTDEDADKARANLDRFEYDNEQEEALTYVEESQFLDFRSSRYDFE